jgi:hypothetical protein
VKEDRVVEDSVGGCLQVGSNQEDSHGDCRRMKMVTLLVQSDSKSFARREDRDNTMVTEGHRYDGRKNSELWSQEDIDEELYELKADIEKLELWMQ